MVRDPSLHLEDLKKLWLSKPFQLGIPIIDLQHVWLVHTILILEEALADVSLDSFREDVRQAFTNALQYVSEHFALEEDLMEHFNYPGFSEHVEGHRQFVAKLAEKFAATEEDEVAALGLLQILKKWLLQHILHDDSDYAEFFKKNNIRINAYSNEILREKKYRISKEQLLIYQNVCNQLDKETVETNESTDIVFDIRKIWRTYDLVTHIPIIDLQHIWLLKMIVELDRAISAGDIEKEQVQKFLNQAIAYTKDHFMVEDKIMRQFRYNDFANHMNQHKRFIDFVQLRNEENKMGGKQAAAHLVQDLRNWLLSHIAFEDKKIGISLQTRVRDLSEFTKKMHQNGEIQITGEQKNLYKAVVQSDPQELH
ncbi:hemerythrin-like metal-binding domain protein [Leptospira ryugenii]|uniref:Hemerythrin-like metal-binding domain protein n=1 Tax=Leptospira ryugenii TaxID=1917863 RepID=A0A2P2E4F3_9LEPT|nr:hemerythrin family protein [Leptospira ryugenii]GBF51753.1 hemerythrin-like metal-binding domain protein [Leptospira ryugenii]